MKIDVAPKVWPGNEGDPDTYAVRVDGREVCFGPRSTCEELAAELRLDMTATGAEVEP